MNAEFPRIARRDKKAFFSNQCKEIEEKNRMGKTRDLFKKIRDTKGTFHAKMGTVKDRFGMDLTEAKDIKKRMFAMTSAFSWQNSISLCPASFCIPRPNLPVTPGVYEDLQDLLELTPQKDVLFIIGDWNAKV